MAWLAVLEKVASIISSILSIAVSVKEFFDNPDEANRQRFEKQMQTILVSREQLLAASDEIRQAITQLSDQVFKITMSDKLGDIDGAMVTLDHWRNHGDETSKALALDRSANALADLLRLADSKAYPLEALVITVLQVLLGRMMILREADPGFCSSETGRSPIEAAFTLIREAATRIAQSLSAPIWKSTTVKKRREEGQIITTWTYKVRYTNRSGTVSYTDSVETERGPDDPDFVADKEFIDAKAQAAEVSGFNRDVIAAGLPAIRGTADQVEAALRQCESSHIASLIFQRKLTYIEKAHYEVARRTSGPKEAMMSIVAKYAKDSDVIALDAKGIRPLSKLLLQAPLTEEQIKAMDVFGKAFGPKRAIQAVLAGLEAVEQSKKRD